MANPFALGDVKAMKCRCGAFVLLGFDQGDVISDMLPLWGQGQIQALLAGRALLDVVRAGGRTMIRRRWAGSLHKGDVFGEHQCAGRGKPGKSDLSEIAPFPTAVHATPSGQPDGQSPIPARVSWPSPSPTPTAPLRPATPAVHRPSEGRTPLALCARCRQFFKPGEDRWSWDQPERAMYTAHVGACPPFDPPLTAFQRRERDRALQGRTAPRADLAKRKSVKNEACTCGRQEDGRWSRGCWYHANLNARLSLTTDKRPLDERVAEAKANVAKWTR